MTKSQVRSLDQSEASESGVIAVSCPGGRESGRSNRIFDFNSPILLFYIPHHPIALIFFPYNWNYTSSLILLTRTILTHRLYLSAPPSSKAMSASGSGAPNSGSGASSSKKPFPQVDLQGNDLPPSPAPSSPHGTRRYNIATELVYTEGSDQYNASSVPIYQVWISREYIGSISLRKYQNR